MMSTEILSFPVEMATSEEFHGFLGGFVFSIPLFTSLCIFILALKIQIRLAYLSGIDMCNFNPRFEFHFLACKTSSVFLQQIYLKLAMAVAVLWWLLPKCFYSLNLCKDGHVSARVENREGFRLTTIIYLLYTSAFDTLNFGLPVQIYTEQSCLHITSIMNFLELLFTPFSLIS
jgi:hypothetical protein